MAVPETTYKAARAIYEYAGKDGLVPWEDLAPTIQISYVEEAEAALSVAAEYIRNLADYVDPDQSDPDDPDDYVPENVVVYIRGAMLAVAQALDPKVEAIDGI